MIFEGFLFDGRENGLETFAEPVTARLSAISPRFEVDFWMNI